VDSRRERVHDEELGLAAMCSLPKLGAFITSFMSGKTARLRVGLASTSRRRVRVGLRIADRASAADGGNDRFPPTAALSRGTKRLILTTSVRQRLRMPTFTRLLAIPCQKPKRVLYHSH
jgi:hypothetical protein